MYPFSVLFRRTSGAVKRDSLRGFFVVSSVGRRTWTTLLFACPVTCNSFVQANHVTRRCHGRTRLGSSGLRGSYRLPSSRCEIHFFRFRTNPLLSISSKFVPESRNAALRPSPRSIAHSASAKRKISHQNSTTPRLGR